jgi:ATP-binding cassette, subfamily B (MDR/TAP), member 1
VLKNFSMKISEGECVALVGASGCGKSTVVALLQRLCEPTEGTISVGLNELWWIDVHHLRNHVAVVNRFRTSGNCSATNELHDYTL